MIKKRKFPLLLTLGTAGGLISSGVAAYLVLLLQNPLPRNLPTGVNIIPQDAVFALSLSTNTGQWRKLREFGTPQLQAELEKNLADWRDRLFADSGFNYQRDIQPWVGEEITIAIMSTQNQKPPLKPVSSDAKDITPAQGIMVVMPVANPVKAQQILANPKNLKAGKWLERTYKGITIKETQNPGEQNYSAALLNGQFLLVSDRPTTLDKAIDAYKDGTSLAKTPGYTDNIPKITTTQPFAEVYVNVPLAAKIATAASNRQLPAQVLAQLQHNQGLAASINLETQGVRLQGVSWLKPNSDRTNRVQNNAGKMQNRLDSETLMMLSGGNLEQLWQDYARASQNNSLAPLQPEKLRAGVKSLTNLDLDRDFLRWMRGEFSVAVIPATPTPGQAQDFRAALVFMVQASDRQRGEQTLEKLDLVMKNQLQFQVQETSIGGNPVVNWISPLAGGKLTATRGWLDNNVAFISLGASVTDKIVPKPQITLASTSKFQQTVPSELNPNNGQFFLDVDSAVKNFPLPSMFPNQQIFLESMHSVGITAAVSARHSTRYDMFFHLKKMSSTQFPPPPVRKQDRK
ncbi:MAG: DUF3352 domain-containing protein [Nostocaceae cyanobacterium]|nr:DUF3352 domain-containing protein [Nostocaceae cyanobacterium]